MKTPLKIRILNKLQKKIEAIPEGVFIPFWLKWAVRITLWYIRITNKIIKIYRKFMSLSGMVLLSNLWLVLISGKSEARVFSGYFYRWLARKYADKRSRISAVNKLCGGKRHYVIQYDSDSLIVINKTEMNMLKSKHVLRKNYNIVDVLEKAFYVTKNKTQKAEA